MDYTFNRTEYETSVKLYFEPSMKDEQYFILGLQTVIFLFFSPVDYSSLVKLCYT